jgi:hypothetical protein
VASFVLLAQADADPGNSGLGYLAIFLWFGIIATVPVLLAVGIPALVMGRRVRRQRVLLQAPQSLSQSQSQQPRARSQPQVSGDAGPRL